MHILFITDQNYLIPTVVSMTSVCESNRSENIVFHILYDRNRALEGSDMLSGVARKYGMQCVMHDFDFSEIESSLPMGRSDMPAHCSIASYYRLFVAGILPDDIDRILYLDSDVIVRGSLKPLFEQSEEYVAVEGVIDNWEGDISKFNRLRYAPSFRYINTGVLMIHLDYWRQENVQNRFVEFVSSNADRIVHHDQDVINACLYGEKKLIPFRYNVQDGFLFPNPNFLFYDQEDLLNMDIERPVIIHYCSPSKPWHSICDHPYAPEYRRYMNIAGFSFSDFPKRKLTAREKLRAILVRMHLIRANSSFRGGLSLK